MSHEHVREDCGCGKVLRATRIRTHFRRNRSVLCLTSVLDKMRLNQHLNTFSRITTTSPCYPQPPLRPQEAAKKVSQLLLHDAAERTVEQPHVNNNTSSFVAVAPIATTVAHYSACKHSKTTITHSISRTRRESLPTRSTVVRRVSHVVSAPDISLQRKELTTVCCASLAVTVADCVTRSFSPLPHVWT